MDRLFVVTDKASGWLVDAVEDLNDVPILRIESVAKSLEVAVYTKNRVLSPDEVSTNLNTKKEK